MLTHVFTVFVNHINLRTNSKILYKTQFYAYSNLNLTGNAMAKIFTKIKHEFFKLLPPTIFFFIAFSLLMITQRLIQREYGVPLTGFGMAAIGALLVGKVVLLTDMLPFVNKFPHKPLLYNIIWKTGIYFSAAFMFRYLEHIVPLLRKYEDVAQAHQHLIEEIVWPHFWLLMIWLGVLFFVYCTMRELVRAIGREKVIQMFISGSEK